MVRLKDFNLVKIYNVNYSFNSNMVRLKVLLSRIKHKNNQRFNSNMVRLKGGTYIEYDSLVDKFQFQYGSIKRISLISRI